MSDDTLKLNESVISPQYEYQVKEGKIVRSGRQSDLEDSAQFGVKELLVIKRQFTFQQFLDTLRDEWLRDAPVLSIAVLLCDGFPGTDIRSTIPRLLKIKNALIEVENIGVVTATIVESLVQISAVVIVSSQSLSQLEEIGYVEVAPSIDAFEAKVVPLFERGRARRWQLHLSFYSYIFYEEVGQSWTFCGIFEKDFA